MAFCNPSSDKQHNSYQRKLRRWGIATVSAIASLCAAIQPALAQDIGVVRDTEIERVLRSYEEPLLVAAGIDPNTVKIFLIQDPSINAFATQSPFDADAEDIFVNTGTLMQLTTPNQIIGILAHETGHIAGGHIVRDAGAMRKASIPMLIGLVVGIAAMIAGAGEAGEAAMMLGEQAAMSQFLAFSRVQEATADQMGQKFLLATHQSGDGMVQVFEKFANEEAMSAYYNKDFISDHPADRDRIDLLQREADASPYKNKPDSPEVVHEFHMIQAKLAGYISKPEAVLARYPASDNSPEAHYARAMAYFRQPELQKALDETNTLIKTDPSNPYFWEVLGQIQVDRSKPMLGVPAYQKAVDLLPSAPLIRIDLAAAQLATENPAFTKRAIENLKIGLDQENNNTFGWYELAQAYSNDNNTPMADLATAELHYQVGDMVGAVHFAGVAQHSLPKGSTDWQHANDIVAAAGPQMKQRREQ